MPQPASEITFPASLVVVNVDFGGVLSRNTGKRVVLSERDIGVGCKSMR